jgi:hypothetical protein
MTHVMSPPARLGDHPVMATALRALPAILSSLLLAAHFLRTGNMLLVTASAALPLLMLVPSRYARYALQGLLLLGAVEWIRTTIALAEFRIQLGAPWARMAAILATVTLFTIASALLVPRRDAERV